MSFNVRKIVGNVPDISHVVPRLMGNSNALPPGISPEQQALAHRELWNLCEASVGVVGQPSSFASNSISFDKMMQLMHTSEEDRYRILVQFMRARHGNAKNAYQMLHKALKWRAEVKIDRYLLNCEAYLSHSAARFPMAVCSTANTSSQPVVYGLIRMLDKKKVQRAPFSEAVIAFFEKLYFKEEYKREEMIVILDFRGWSLRKHAPLRIVKEGLTTLQAYYPERLDKVFLVNYPSSIKAVYNAISPIIDSGARSKIVFASRDPSIEMSKHEISPKSIPTFMGGDLDAQLPEIWPDIAHEWKNPELQANNVW